MNSETAIERTADSVNLVVTEKDQNGDFYIPVKMAQFTELIAKNAELQCKIEQEQSRYWEASLENKQLKNKITVLEEMVKEWATK